MKEAVIISIREKSLLDIPCFLSVPTFVLFERQLRDRQNLVIGTRAPQDMPPGVGLKLVVRNGGHHNRKRVIPEMEYGRPNLGKHPA